MLIGPFVTKAGSSITSFDPASIGQDPGEHPLPLTAAVPWSFQHMVAVPRLANQRLDLEVTAVSADGVVGTFVATKLASDHGPVRETGATGAGMGVACAKAAAGSSAKATAKAALPKR